MKVWGNQPLTSISSEMVENYRTSLLNVGLTTSHVNRNLAVLQYIYSTGMEWGYVKLNPLRKVKRTNQNNYRIRWLTDIEEKELLNISSIDLKRVIVFAINTGFRKDEMCHLTWNDVDFDRKEVRVLAAYSKTNSSRVVPMNKKVCELLGEMKNEMKHDLRHESISSRVFRWNYNNSYSLRKAFREATKSAKIKDCRFHDLRHTFASRLVMKGVDIRTVQELMGHALISMTLRYSHLSAEHKQRAIDLLDD